MSRLPYPVVWSWGCETTDLSVQLKPNEEFVYTWTQGSDSRYADPGEYKVTTTYTTPEGKGELSVPITITNQRYVIGDMANVVLSTDKPSYDIGEKIIITMENIGNSTALYSALPVGRYRTELSGEKWLPKEIEALVEPGKTTNVDALMKPR